MLFRSAKVTDNLGNGVSGVTISVAVSGGTTLAGGALSAQWTTDSTGVYTFTLASSSSNDATVKVSASATAVVSISGTISSLIISDGGVGYTTSPIVSIYSTIGYGASAYANVGASGTITSIDIVQSGIGYTFTSPPIVLIEPNPRVSETLSSPTYYGDFGIIVGIATTSIVGVATTGINFDLFIPLDSPFRNSLIVSSTKYISGISTNDYIVIKPLYFILMF